MATGSPPDPDQLLQHAAFIRSVAWATLHGDDLVDDVVQETWVAALGGAPQRRGPLAPWLAGVARNKARDLLRRRAAERRRDAAAARPERASPQQEVIDRLEIERRLIGAVEALPEHYRTPLVLRYLEDLPPRVIAVRLDLPVNTVRTRVRRGLAQLRAQLEADHGDGARDWRLALVPLLHAHPSSSTALVGASGGLLVAKKLLVPLLALVLLAGGVVLMFPGLLQSSSPERSEGVPEARGDPKHQASTPALVGRSGDGRRDEGDMAERDSAEEPGTTPGPSESEPGTGWGDVMRTLVADIRRDVAPEWWGAHPELATLEGRNGIVIARAPPDVLDAIGRYLDARRAGALDGEVMPPQLEAHLLDAARGALRPILLGIFEREQKIGRAVVAWEKGDLSAAQAMATEVLSQEPDNDYAQVILRGTANAAESQAPDGRTQKDFDRTRMRFQDARRQQTLDTWIMCWPSVRTWKAVQSVLKKAGASEFRKLAPDFDLLLNRGSVTLEMGDASLHDAVRRLQIETLADIRLSRNVVEEGAQIRVQNFREEARSLRWVLEELVGSLPEGWTWYAARQHVSLTRTGSDQDTKPETRVRYFDVKDILAPGTRPPVSSAEPESGSPPVPPVYRRDPVSGEPVPVKER